MNMHAVLKALRAEDEGEELLKLQQYDDEEVDDLEVVKIVIIVLNEVDEVDEKLQLEIIYQNVLVII